MDIKNNLDQIIKKIKQAKPYLENNYYVTEIGVFGSYVRNEQTSESDLDILIDYQRGLILLKMVRLGRFLSDLLGVKVDLTLKKSLKQAIGKIILSEVYRKRLYSEQASRYSLERHYRYEKCCYPCL